MPSFWTQTDRISAPLSAGRTLRRLSRLLSASSTVCSLTECRNVHWAQAPRRAITDPLRCQADMKQMPWTAAPGHRTHDEKTKLGGYSFFQNSFSISRYLDTVRGILNGDLRCSRFSLRRSRASPLQVAGQLSVPKDLTSLSELCLQHRAAEKRFRAVKPQAARAAAGNSGFSVSRVSTLPDAACNISILAVCLTVRHQ